ncbi:hypothetical protein [Streptomyces diastatochromogenes]|uniref:hypothetical protein n=1 Tax=Streptomyces diastatochromogenes TaxID=42236 RepID=UPI00367D1A38
MPISGMSLSIAAMRLPQVGQKPRFASPSKDECGWCGGDNYFVGRQVGFWVDRWEIPLEWDCRFCDGLNYIPDPPWTEA